MNLNPPPQQRPHNPSLKQQQPWSSYSEYLQARFGERVYKVTVAAGFTCPTRDGSKGSLGCAFCDERGSSSFYSSENAAKSIRAQLDRAIPEIAERFRVKKFLAYFQSFTNTYGPIPYLREVYEGALGVDGVVGMAVGTRPDCVPDEVLELLNDYGRNQYVSLELGLQSIRNEALEFYARGHSPAEGIDAIKRALRFRNLNISVHLMFGAPGDTVETAIETALLMNELGVHGVKIHQLMVLKNTLLAERYKTAPWPLLEIDEYNSMAASFLENLSPGIHVERTHALTSHPDELVGPAWSSSRFDGFNRLKHLMWDRGSRQGSKLTTIPKH